MYGSHITTECLCITNTTIPFNSPGASSFPYLTSSNSIFAYLSSSLIGWANYRVDGIHYNLVQSIYKTSHPSNIPVAKSNWYFCFFLWRFLCHFYTTIKSKSATTVTHSTLHTPRYTLKTVTDRQLFTHKTTEVVQTARHVWRPLPNITSEESRAFIIIKWRLPGCHCQGCISEVRNF